MSVQFLYANWNYIFSYEFCSQLVLWNTSKSIPFSFTARTPITYCISEITGEGEGSNCNKIQFTFHCISWGGSVLYLVLYWSKWFITGCVSVNTAREDRRGDYLEIVLLIGVCHRRELHVAQYTRGSERCVIKMQHTNATWDVCLWQTAFRPHWYIGCKVILLVAKYGVNREPVDSWCSQMKWADESHQNHLISVGLTILCVCECDFERHWLHLI